MSTLPSCLYRLSSVASHISTDSVEMSRLIIGPIVRVFSSTLLPGFIGPESSVLPTDLPPSVRPRFGNLPRRVRFIVPIIYYGNQSGRASLGKTHSLSICRPASLRFGSPDIRTRSLTPARPPPRCHIAGSLFATYMDSASCFLQTAHY